MSPFPFDPTGATALILGQGYVGLPIAMRAVSAGYRVLAYEPDKRRARALRNHVSYIEDVSNDALAQTVATGRYEVLSSLPGRTRFDFAVITVPTPLREGVPDLSFIEAAARSLAPLIRPGCTVILESTTYPGTTEHLLRPLLEAEGTLKAGEDFFLAYSPERIDPGNPNWTFEGTPKLVAGLNEASLVRANAFYNSLVSTVVPVPSIQVAELAKLVENTFRHVNIALVNELAMFAADLNVDIWEAIEAASTKPFGFMRFLPGPGVGGHCLPIDPSYLSWKVKQSLGRSFRFIELANDINDHMPHHVVSRIAQLLNRDHLPLNGSHILLLGMAYKRNSSDAREAPAPVIASLLRAEGAHVEIADPHVREAHLPTDIPLVELTATRLKRADLVVVVTDHDAFPWDEIRAFSSRVFDTRHRLAPAPHISYL